jgi:hypothetical protein
MHSAAAPPPNPALVKLLRCVKRIDAYHSLTSPVVLCVPPWLRTFDLLIKYQIPGRIEAEGNRRYLRISPGWSNSQRKCSELRVVSSPSAVFI